MTSLHDIIEHHLTRLAFFTADMQESVAKMRSEGSRVLVVLDFDCTLLQVGR